MGSYLEKLLVIGHCDLERKTEFLNVLFEKWNRMCTFYKRVCKCVTNFDIPSYVRCVATTVEGYNECDRLYSIYRAARLKNYSVLSSEWRLNKFLHFVRLINQF